MKNGYPSPPPPNATTHEVGQYFETLTAVWMKKNGYKIIERNRVFHPYEIDIIAVKGGTLCMTEVKSAPINSYPPEMKINQRKMRALSIAAEKYSEFLSERGIDTSELEIRFDAATFVHDKDYSVTDFRYYENYFSPENIDEKLFETGDFQ